MAGASQIIRAADFTMPESGRKVCLLVVADSSVLDETFSALESMSADAFNEQLQASASWSGLTEHGLKLARLDIVVHAPVRDLARLVTSADAVRPVLELIAGGAPAFIIRQKMLTQLDTSPGDDVLHPGVRESFRRAVASVG
jgi:hypothetical protein